MKKYSSPKVTIVERTLGTGKSAASEFASAFQKAFTFGGPRAIALKDFALEPCLA